MVSRSSEETPAFVAGDVGAIGCVQGEARLDRVRAFVKVQDGCSFSCNFCVIPLVRGGPRAAGARQRCSPRSAGASTRDTSRSCSPGSTSAATATARPATTWHGWCGRRAPRRGFARLRLSSIEVNHLTEPLLDALRETPTVSRHLHVPLQSGDDYVLGAMARRYDSRTYLRRVAAAGDFNLTTDVIVGFPAEDDGAFENTLRVVEEAGATKVHVFPVLAASGYGDRCGGHGAEAGEEGAERPAARTLARRVRAPLAREGRGRGRRSRRPPGPRLRRRLLAVAGRRSGRRPCPRAWRCRHGRRDSRRMSMRHRLDGVAQGAQAPALPALERE